MNSEERGRDEGGHYADATALLGRCSIKVSRLMLLFHHYKFVVFIFRQIFFLFI